MALLTDKQLHEIRQIIADHHSAFVINTIGSNVIPPEIVERLKEKGLINVQSQDMKDAYLYGQLLVATDDPKVQNMSYDEFKTHIKKNPIPLNDNEERAVAMAQQRAGQYAVGLGNTIDKQTGAVLIEADAGLRARMRKEIKTATAENIAKRETVKQLKSDLGWATRDWARDWDRIAVTEKHTAMQEGTADHYLEKYGEDVLVFKRALPGACKHCLRLHTGSDGHPIIYKLSELMANGTNVGKKAVDWLAVTGSVHPNCQCMLVRMPEGWGFNEDGELWPGGKFGKRFGEHEMKKSLMEKMDLQKGFKLQGHTTFQEIPIAIENKAGSIRKWTDENGKEGQTKMKHTYGFMKRTTGADQDEVDVFLGPNADAEFAYVVHQQNHKNGVYDEDKVMLGFASQKEAVKAYMDNYDKPDFFVACSPIKMDAFKRWAGLTKPKKGEMMKSEGPRFTLVKAQRGLSSTGNQTPEQAAEYSRAIARSPSPGTSTNYVFNAPKRRKDASILKDGFSPTRDDLLDQDADAADVRLVRDKAEYDVSGVREREPHTIEQPDYSYWGGPSRTAEAEKNHETLENEVKRRAPWNNESPKKKRKKKQVRKASKVS